MSKKNTQTNDAANRLAEEAHAFDRQILERVAAGHIPDLRRAEFCPYFYNNTWRHPDYVKLDFGEKFQLVLEALNSHAPLSQAPQRILEVGCGPGYLSLELARNGFQVTGVDLSPVCVDMARHFAAQDPWVEGRGPINYLAGDFLELDTLLKKSFTAIVLVGALHHLPDQWRVGERMTELLVDDGIVVINEPTRDRMTKGNAAFIHLVRLLLSVGGGYYQNVAIPNTYPEQCAAVEEIYREMRYESESGDKLQSVNDNEAGFSEMHAMLDSTFFTVLLEEKYAFFHELIGGLRFPDEINKQLARYLRDMDGEMCKGGVLQPTEFFYVGRKKGNG
jgi:2-polyprenyl-3-methyl-5-hydroxy-6-metoxy-1,4-benzoquinol methylase